MKSFWWIRHGPTHRRDMIGWTDAPADLSDHERLKQIEAYLPQDAAVISSDLTRATTTADAIQGARRRLEHDPDLREIHFGGWEARTFDEIQRTHPNLSRRYWETPGDVRPPDGESWNDLTRRVDRAFDRLNALSENIIIVAHFGTILSRLQQVRECTAYEIMAQKIDNLSVTRFDFSQGNWRERLTNHHP